jgi:hypothetical protein
MQGPMPRGNKRVLFGSSIIASKVMTPLYPLLLHSFYNDLVNHREYLIETYVYPQVSNLDHPVVTWLIFKDGVCCE